MSVISETKCFNNIADDECVRFASHYEKLVIFIQGYKLKINIWKSFDVFNIFSQNIHCGYTLEPPNEYPQSMFWSKNKRNRFGPAKFRFNI